MKLKTILVLLGIALLAVLFLGVLFGSSSLGPVESLKAIGDFLGLTKADPTHKDIVLLLRFPRAITAVLSGMALGLAGLLSQTLFRNDLADPYIAGIGSGAVLGVNLVLFFGTSLGILGLSAISIAAFVGAWASCLVIWVVSNRTGSTGTSLVLAGVALSFLLSGLNFLLVMVGRDILSRSVFWSWNGLATSNWSNAIILVSFIAIAVAAIGGLVRQMDVYQLGDEQAVYLGVNPRKLRTILFVITSLLTGAAVASAGLLGFVGLITPHVARRMVGGDSKKLVPVCFLLGGVLLGIADVVGRVIVPFQEIPPGVIMSLVGGVFFLWLVARRPTW